MENKSIFVTTMYRHGNRESHSYVEYAGFDPYSAISAGVQEAETRVGKYFYEVVELFVGIPGRIGVFKTEIDN